MREGGLWPTREQEWLLRAALLQGPQAMEAWRAWESSVDINEAEHESQRLLPLLYHNLRRQGVETPLNDRLKGVYRATWVKNQLALHDLAAVLAALRDAGIETMLLKGAAMVALHYKDPGLRPMNDLDLMVRPEHTFAAIDVLLEQGWRPKLWPVERLTEARFSYYHAHEFVNLNDRQLDLHWHAMLECCYAGADDDFWDGAVSTSLRGLPTLALNPADQLLHVCVHGTQWNPEPPARWVADAMAILRSPGSELAWDRLLAQAEQRRLVGRLRDALHYLRDCVDAPIPSDVLDSLQRLPVSSIETVERRARTQFWGLAGPLATITSYYVRSLPQDKTFVSMVANYPRFLQEYWGLDNLGQLPTMLFSKARTRARRVFAGSRASGQ